MSEVCGFEGGLLVEDMSVKANSVSGSVSLTIDDVGKIYFNSDTVEITLPAIPANPVSTRDLTFEFVVYSDTKYLKVVAGGASDVFRYKNQVSAVGGYIRSDAIGNRVRIRPFIANEWLICDIEGTWLFDE